MADGEWAAGWTIFAAAMLSILGFFHAFAGLAGILNSDLFVENPSWLLDLDVNTWGWVQLVFGSVAFVGGVALFAGAPWARAFGIVYVALTSIGTFIWMPHYPLWGVVLLATSLAALWGLTVRGRDILEGA